jgi:murein DD-endopeptidase MepM/ murein hydrolase activator NlpD
VPSARAGQRPVPSARPYAHPRAVTGSFLLTIVTIVVGIVILTPEYAKPAVSADRPLASASPSLDPFAPTGSAADLEPASRPPSELKGYAWPTKSGRIIGWFGPSKSGFVEIGGTRMHEGLDIASTCGAPVMAAHKGTVLAAGRDFVRAMGFDATGAEIKRFMKRLDRKLGKGGARKALPISVVIDDGNGYRSVYKHLADVNVKSGEKVKRGAVIGHVGQTGGVTPCHVQYELVRMDGEWLRVVDREARALGYPRWIRERVDPTLVLEVGAKPGPRVVKGFPRPE